MEQKDIRRIQLEQLKMAKELKRVCEAAHITYFMDSGTLLGAIRHGGFIPWDDDMDFGMLREDYERFVRLPQKCFSGGVFPADLGQRPTISLCFCQAAKEGDIVRRVID